LRVLTTTFADPIRGSVRSPPRGSVADSERWHPCSVRSGADHAKWLGRPPARGRGIAKVQKYAIESFAESLIPVADSLERALERARPIEKLREGVQITLKQLLAAFERSADRINRSPEIRPAPAPGVFDVPVAEVERSPGAITWFRAPERLDARRSRAAAALVMSAGT